MFRQDFGKSKARIEKTARPVPCLARVATAAVQRKRQKENRKALALRGRWEEALKAACPRGGRNGCA
jgi:hypothetical protein